VLANGYVQVITVDLDELVRDEELYLAMASCTTRSF
jgi:hypothetical protein